MSIILVLALRQQSKPLILVERLEKRALLQGKGVAHPPFWGQLLGPALPIVDRERMLAPKLQW
jgi:hypothetical protein